MKKIDHLEQLAREATLDPSTVLKLVAVARAAQEWKRESFASDEDVERGDFSDERALAAAYKLAAALAAIQGDGNE